MSKKKILVIGASSFLGRSFLRAFDLKTDLIFTISRQQSEGNSGNHFIGDVFDGRFFANVIEEVQPSIIVNFVGSTDGSLELDDLIDLNMGVLKIWHEHISQERRLEQKFFTMGSAAEYGRASDNPLSEETECIPAGAYGESKFAQTELAKKLSKEGEEIFIIRPFNLMGFGSPDSLISEKIRLKVLALSKDEDLILDDPQMARDFIDVDDFSEALRQLTEGNSSGGIYNICRGEKVTLADLGRAYLDEAGKGGSVIAAENPKFRSSVRSAVGSCDLLKRVTGWAPKRTLIESASLQSKSEV